MRIAFCVGVVLIVGEVCAQTPGKDAHGVPLPTGAVARLGSAAFHHHDGIQAFGLSGDGKLLATFTDNDGFNIWDIAERKILKQMKLKRSNEPITHMHVSADGKLVALVYQQGHHQISTRAFDWMKGEDIVIDAKAKTTTAAFSPDGKLAAFALDNATFDVVLWDANARKELRRFPGNRHSHRLAFSHDSAMLTAVAPSGEVRVWELKAEGVKPVRESMGSTPLEISLDGTWSLLGNPWYYFQVDEMRTGKKRLYLQKAGGVARFGHHPDLLLVTSQKELVLHDVSTGEVKTRIPVTQHNTPKADLSRDGKLLALVYSHQVHLHDLTVPDEKRRELGWNDHTVDLLAFSPDGKQLAAASRWGHRVVLWDVATARPVRTPLYSYHPTELRFSPDGKKLWTISGNAYRTEDLSTHKIETREPDSHTMLHRSPDGKTWIRHARRAGVQHLSDEASPRGAKTKIEIVDAEAKKVLKELTLDGHFVEVSPDRKTFLTAHGARDSSIFRSSLPPFIPVGGWMIWDAETGKQRGTIVDRSLTKEKLKTIQEELPFREMARAPTLLSYSPDGRRIAWMSGITVDRVIISDLQTGAEVGSFAAKVHGPPAFSPDGKTVACNTPEKAIHLLEVATGQVRARFEGLSDSAVSAQFSPDGTILATGTRDATIVLWDAFALRAAKAKERLSDKDLADAWDAFGGNDGKNAHTAALELRQHASQSVPFLRERIETFMKSEAMRQIPSAIAALDSDVFTTRQTAEKKLKQLGSLALPALAKALDAPRSLESRRRIEKIVQEMEGTPTGAWLQAYRALEVIERIGGTDAMTALDALGRGEATSPVTIEAAICAGRLAGRK